LAQAVEGAGVPQGEGVGLGLQAHFYGVEGVFDVFSCYACDLKFIRRRDMKKGEV
jgi:hypothetical protein